MCACGMEHVAPSSQAGLAAVRAAALREAAVAIDLSGIYAGWEGVSVTESVNASAAAEVWLRQRADKIEKGMTDA